MAAFQLKRHEPAGAGIRRIIRRQLEDTLAGCAGRTAAKGSVAHDTRVQFKKVRACLRLVCDGLGSEIYRRENSCFRDASRPLARVREAEVLIETLDRLTGYFTEQLLTEDFSGIRKVLQQRYEAAQTRVLEEQHVLADIVRTVKKARDRLKEWPVKKKGWAALKRGLRRSYRNSRRAFITARQQPGEDNLHEWRKQSKYLWYQLLVMKPAWPAGIEQWDKALHTLTQALGDNHDLIVLRRTLEAGKGAFGKNVNLLLPLIDCRREELQQQALSLGERLYRDKPRIFVQRMEKRWKKWHSPR